MATTSPDPRRSTMRRRLPAIGAILGAITIGISACGTSSNHASHMSSDMPHSSSTAAAQNDHDDADVMFARMMVPHHQGAIEMAKLAPSRAASADVKDLAVQIEAAQDPEIRTMQGWLSAWGTSASDQMMHDVPGMMSSTDMAALTSATGAAFDRQFLTGMIAHHQGAIEMAKTEIVDGRFEPAKAMARNIVTSQQAEIDRMRSLLSGA